MKRILSIIAAGCLALMALSCVKEEVKAVVDTSTATPPALVSATVDDNVTVQFTPAVFKMDFNQKMGTYHTLALVSVKGTATNVTFSTKKEDNTLILTGKNLTNALKNRGCQPLEAVSVAIVVRASIQDPAKGITNGFVDSKEKYEFTWVMPEEREEPGNPWADFTEASPWGLIGSIASTGNNWNADGPMYMTPDGNKHVARNVKLTPDDQFKVRKDGGWDTNFGAPGDTEPYVMTVGEAIEATAGGKNLGVPAEGNYDLLLDEDAGTLTLYAAFETYPGFDEISNWSVIGAIASFEMEWNKDIQMITDGEWHVAEGVVLTPNDQFKFRMDQKWDTNIGAAGDTEPFVVTLGEEYSGAAGGKNLAVAVDGAYDLLCNPATNSFMVVESLGGKSPLIGGDEPGPEPVEVKGWNVIGLNGKWGDGEDILATEKDGVWTAYITAADATEFKWRKDGKWESDYGMSKDEGYTYTVGTAFPAVAGGANIPVDAGFYKVVLDLSDAEAPTITVFSDFEVWALIGVNGDWDNDIDMNLTDGKWVSPATKIKDEFKIRKNHSWAADYGMSKEEGYAIEVGKAFPAVAGGANIKVPAEAEYVITLDLEAETILVENALPSNQWSVIGSVNGTSWNKDFYMTNTDGVWVSEELEFEASSEFKLRFNNSWADADCIGGSEDGIALEPGLAIEPAHPGKNLKVKNAGKYHVVYDTNTNLVFLQGWALIGGISGTSWNKDFMMQMGPDGRWWSDVVKISGEFKLRKNSSWADPDTRGATEDGFKFEPLTAFSVASPGKNIGVPEEGYYAVAYDADKEEVTVYRAEWALIGEVNGTVWSKDFHLVELAAGVYFNLSVQLDGEFKIRRNESWDDADTRGATEEGFTFTSGTPFTVAGPGKNIKTPTPGVYTVQYTPATEEVVITTLVL